MEPLPAGRNDGLRARIHALPVFVQAQMFYAYAQTGPRLGSAQTDRLRTIVWSDVTDQTWTDRLKNIQAIVTTPSRGPNRGERRKHGLLLAILTFILVHPVSGTMDLAQVSTQLTELQQAIQQEIKPGIMQLAHVENGPLFSRLEKNMTYLEDIFGSMEKTLPLCIDSLRVAASPWWQTPPPLSDEILHILTQFPETSTPMHSTFLHLLPMIYGSLSDRVNNDLNVRQREDFMVVWIVTLKLVEHVIQPGSTLTLVSQSSDVAEHYRAFLDPSALDVAVYTGEKENQQTHNRNEDIRKAVNGVLASVQHKLRWKKILMQFREDTPWTDDIQFFATLIGAISAVVLGGSTRYASRTMAIQDFPDDQEEDFDLDERRTCWYSCPTCQETMYVLNASDHRCAVQNVHIIK